jgi:hypothetical protein
MKINLVKSSNVLGLSYSRKTRVMTVVFRSGLSMYRYYDVPFNTYVKVLKSSSIGKSLNTLIKGTYTYERVTNE